MWKNDVIINYVCYEDDFYGLHTVEETRKIYQKFIDKNEWKNFTDWLDDMLRNGIFYRVEL